MSFLIAVGEACTKGWGPTHLVAALIAATKNQSCTRVASNHAEVTRRRSAGSLAVGMLAEKGGACGRSVWTDPRGRTARIKDSVQLSLNPEKLRFRELASGNSL